MSERSTASAPKPTVATEQTRLPAPPDQPVADPIDRPAATPDDDAGPERGAAGSESHPAAARPALVVDESSPDRSSEETAAGESGAGTGPAEAGSQRAVDGADPGAGESGSTSGRPEPAAAHPAAPRETEADRGATETVADRGSAADVVGGVPDETAAAVLIAAEAAAHAATAAAAAAAAAADAADAAVEAARAAAVAAELAAAGSATAAGPAGDMPETEKPEDEEEPAASAVDGDLPEGGVPEDEVPEDEEGAAPARGLSRWTSDRRPDLVSYLLVPVVTLFAAPMLVAVLGLAILGSGSEPPSVCDEVRAVNGCEELTLSLVSAHVLGFLVFWAALWVLPWWRGLRLPRLLLAVASGLVLFAAVLRMAA